MYCRNCGNKLKDTDNFCNSCGEKATEDTKSIITEPPANNPYNYNTLNEAANSSQNILFKNPIIKTIFLTILYMLFTIICYSIVLPKNISTVEFITNPRGLTAIIGQCFGASIVELVIFLPLLYGLRNLNIITSSHKLNAFFIIMVTVLIGNLLFGNTLYKTILPPITIGAFVIGLILLVIARFKKNVKNR